MIEKIRIIHIDWKKYEYTEENIKKLSEVYDYGIYQIYGDHPVYGENVLLYIGEANKITFAVRLKERTEFKETVLRPKQFRVGRLFYTKDCINDNWNEMVDIAEKILIKAHAPAYNSVDIKGLFHKGDDMIVKENFIIKNWDQYGQLLPEVSSMNVTYNYWYEFESKKGKYIGQ